jgi:hypothetical protein
MVCVIFLLVSGLWILNEKAWNSGPCLASHEDIMDYIQPALRRLAVDISSLEPNKEVVKSHASRNFRIVKNSLQRFGQAKPVVVDENNVERVGGLVFLAMKELGYQQIAVVRPSWEESKFREEFKKRNDDKTLPNLRQTCAARASMTIS